MEKRKTDSSSLKKSEKKSLLERYDIPVEHLSYEYISKCSNGKLLERIVTILRSGEEGFYPDLTKHAENRLIDVKPNSRVLRKCEPIRSREMLEPVERREVEADIDSWMSEMQTREKDLDDGKMIFTDDPFPQPAIRQFKEEIPQNNKTLSKNFGKKQRIGSCDYTGWDKYDVDTEINKIDLLDEQSRMETKRFQKKQREMAEKMKKVKETIIDKSSLTGTELEILARQEREKGNEAFRAGDYLEALEHYNSSVKIDPNLTTLNNRAMTYIKLQRYEEALNDCNLVLNGERANVKALLRRGMSLEHLKKPSLALEDYESALKLEPTNKIAIAAVKKLRRPCETKKIRMAIEEKKDNEEEKLMGSLVKKMCSHDAKSNANIDDGICFCDRAPGPSQNVKPRPHFKADYCLENEIKKSTDNLSNAVKLEKRKTEKQAKTSNAICKTSAFPAKQKSIFSYVTSPTSASSAIIEEIPNEAKDSMAVKKIDLDKKLRNLKILDVKNANNNRGEGFCLNETSEMKPRTIQVSEKYKKKTAKAENHHFEKFGNIDSPYEFVRAWHSLKNDADLKLRAKLLRSLSTDRLTTIIGNKLDGAMFSSIIRCLEQHFCNPGDSKLLDDFLKSFSQVNRFSIVSMFMDKDDKIAIKNMLRFLEEQGAPQVSLLREAYYI